MKYNYFITLVLLSFIFQVGYSQNLIINEFLASSDSTKTESQFQSDWIEIYNPGDKAVNIGGFLITDNFKNKGKYYIPTSNASLTTIKPKGFLVLVADKNPEAGILHIDFNLDSDGEQIGLLQIVGPDTVFIDSISFTKQSKLVSQGRYPDGENVWFYYSTPTQGKSNNTRKFMGTASDPKFSQTDGFYMVPIKLQLSANIENAFIFYTIDGKTPDSTSFLYKDPISVDSTMVIRAIVAHKDYLPGDLVTHTYFINEPFVGLKESQRIPIVCITTDPKNLWDDNTGIYTKGKKGIQGCATTANFWQEWEREAYIQFFEKNGNIGFDQTAGISMFGGCSREFQQKSFAVKARKEYGKDNFDYQLFNNKNIEHFESFILRNAGNDWSLTMMRDAVAQELVYNKMDVDLQGNLKVLVYLNGQFWGIYDLKEKINEDYLRNNHGIDKDKVDLAENIEGNILAGTNKNYLQFRDFISGNDLSSKIKFDYAASFVDVKEFMNFQIAQIYYNNIDLPSNNKFWRPDVPGGKWRWIIYDTELGLAQDTANYGVSYNMVDFTTKDNLGPGWPFLQPRSTLALMKFLTNNDFKNEFLQSFAAHLNITFSTSRVMAVIDSMKHEIEPFIPMQIEKYGGVTVAWNPRGTFFSTTEQWLENLNVIQNFAKLRPYYLKKYLMERFEIKDTVNLTLTNPDLKAGNLKVCDITMADKVNKGAYFADIPIKLQANPAPGYVFVKWTGSPVNDSLTNPVTIHLKENATISPVFAVSPSVVISEIHYNSKKGNTYDFIELYNPSNTTIDLTGYYFTKGLDFKFSKGSILNSTEYLIIAKDTNSYKDVTSKKYRWNTGGLSDFGETVTFADSKGKTVDEVVYLNTEPWPLDADGLGPSLELVSPFTDNTNPASWMASSIDGGTPGKTNVPPIYKYLVINEVMTDNKSSVVNEEYKNSDWFEIHNTGNMAMDMAGLFLSNDSSNLFAYKIPYGKGTETTIQPDEYKLFWADENTTLSPLHTSFKLAKEGGQIFLSVDKSMIIDTFSYQEVLADKSYGIYPENEESKLTFEIPTPLAKNSLPPVITSIPVDTVLIGKSYSYVVKAVDKDKDYLTFWVGKLPKWLTFKPNSDGTTALLEGTPDESGISKVALNIFVTDGFTPPVLQTYTLIIKKPVGVQQLSNNQNINLYPVPAKEYLKIELKNILFAKGTIEVQNLSGILVKKLKLDNLNKDLHINVKNYAPGIYILKINLDGKLHFKKFVKI